MYKMGMSGRKWDIFLASVKLFSAQSYDSVSVRDIASEVGLQAGSLYTHFTSKEEILETIYAYLEGYYREVSLSDIESRLDRAETDDLDKLVATRRVWPAEMQEILRQILRIVMSRMYCDPKAKELFWETAVTPAYANDRPTLKRLIELGRVEDFDVDAFLALKVSYGVYATMLFVLGETLEGDLWNRGYDLLTEIVLKDAFKDVVEQIEQ